MNDKGFDLKEYTLSLIDSQIQQANSLLRFSEGELLEYKDLLTIFKETNGSNASNKEKGDSLESLVKFIIDKSVVFESYNNVQTSSNEIDILVRLSKVGNVFKAQGLLSIDGNLLAECKNYNKSVAATWVGKFYALMNYTQNQLGILFSYHGLSGNGWNDGTGLTKKLFLSDKKNYIIDFNIHDFEELAAGNISFINMIYNKMFCLKNDISIDNLITEHPNQRSFE